VDRADGDGGGELGGDLGEDGTTEPVAVALDDRDEPWTPPGDPVDVRPPARVVDGQPKRHENTLTDASE
jgi:hypothetical protein